MRPSSIAATERFTGRAGAYAAGRPGYPDAAIDALFEALPDPSALTVVDLGAGTGISSRLLADRGARVVAVEPNAAMRAAAAGHTRVTWVNATAEETGLPAAGAQLVTAFQAFHWFDQPRAIAEMERLLLPGGRAALVYNERDERDPFTAAYGAIVRRHATDETERRRELGPRTFAEHPGWNVTRLILIPHAEPYDRGKLHKRAMSTSYLPHEGRESAALHTEIDEIFDRYACGGAVTMALQTRLTIGETPR